MSSTRPAPTNTPTSSGWPEAVAEASAWPDPLIDMSETMPYATLQSAFDFFFPDGGRCYFKSHFMDELTDDAIAALIQRAEARANEEPFIVIRTLGGAIARVSPDDSAYPHRGACFNVSVDCVWSDAGDEAAIIGWARLTWEA